ncbi:hypothetical protein ACIPSA_44320 [Streptomyces sp. NPDC086549]|uniref:hypothetical protein n=1 Tax=Streptomyces sp. NPDC086549 TaxID=3365752 RepID=UPI00382374AB
MTSGIRHTGWWIPLRNAAFFLVGGALGLTLMAMVTHRTAGAVPWGGLLFGTAVTAIAGAVAAKRRR